MDKKTILLTGGAGFIGSHVAKLLLDQGHKVVVIDDFNEVMYASPIKFDRIKHVIGVQGYDSEEMFVAKDQDFVLYRGSILDNDLLGQIIKENNIDQICHLAALAGVRLSLQMPYKYYEVNVLGTLNLFELTKKHKISSVVYASSSSVYGGNTNYPFSEDQKVDNPISPYAATKKACEEMAAAYHHLYGVHATGLRFFTVYGPWGRPDMAALIFAKAMLAKKPIKLFNQGKMYRDFTYVNDIANGVVLALEKNCAHEVFNLGNSNTEELMDLVNYLEVSLGVKAIKELAPMQAGDVLKTAADITKANRLLGWEPKTSLKEGISNLGKWYKEYYG